MKNYFFISPLLNLIARHQFFNRAIAISLRAAAVLIVLVSLVSFFQASKVIFNLPATGILGGILFQLIYIAAIYAVVHIFIIRADDIKNLPGSEFNTITLLSVLLQLIGEAYAAFVSLIAVGGGIFIWFTTEGIDKLLSPVPRFLPNFGDASFLGGIQFIIGGIFVAIVALVLSYCLSELMILLARVAKNSRA
jgi:hypothetical protein